MTVEPTESLKYFRAIHGLAMSKTIFDAVAEGVSNIVRNPLFWLFVGMGVVAVAASQAFKSPPPQERYVPPNESILRELPGGVIELAEGPLVERVRIRRI